MILSALLGTRVSKALYCDQILDPGTPPRGLRSAPQVSVLAQGSGAQGLSIRGCTGEDWRGPPGPGYRSHYFSIGFRLKKCRHRNLAPAGPPQKRIVIEFTRGKGGAKEAQERSGAHLDTKPMGGEAGWLPGAGILFSI